jgi:hypothetical protein
VSPAGTGARELPACRAAITRQPQGTKGPGCFKPAYHRRYYLVAPGHKEIRSGKRGVILTRAAGGPGYPAGSRGEIKDQDKGKRRDQPARRLYPGEPGGPSRQAGAGGLTRRGLIEVSAGAPRSGYDRQRRYKTREQSRGQRAPGNPLSLPG